MLAVEIDNLGISFPGTEVFANVSLQIRCGEFVAIVGPNGSGKSTLLKLISRILRPKQGSIKLYGQPLKTFTDWNKVSYIAQASYQQQKNFPVSAGEVVAMGLLVGKTFALPWLSRREQQKVEAALSLVGMQGYAKRFFGSLSGGQKQKILLARALVADSHLLLLDEPTSGIDADAKREIYTLLQQLNKQNKNTIIMVSHDMELAASVADKVLCLEKGGVCYWGGAEQMLQHRHKGGYYFSCAGEH